MKRVCAFALALATASSHAAEWRGHVGLLTSFEHVYFEGAVDDPIEECCGWVTTGNAGDYSTDGDRHALGGRIAISATSKNGTFEFGWINFGTWDMWVDGGPGATGELHASALYGAGIWPVLQVGAWTAKVAVGVHRNQVRVRTHDRITDEATAGATPKRKFDETSTGHMVGIRIANGAWSIEIEQWRSLGYAQTTGRLDPVVLGASYRFPL